MNTSLLENWEAVVWYSNKSKYKHFSFDFWNTIAFSNEIFKQKRSELIALLTNNLIDVQTINSTFSKVGKEYNIYQEKGNLTVNSIQLLKNVLQELKIVISNDQLMELKKGIDNLFLEFHPIVDPSIEDIFRNLREKGITISITSNTAFINGEQIRNFLKKVGLLPYISFCIFSDECGNAKPNSQIFKLLYLNASQLHQELNLENIVHFGDNRIADFLGARNQMMESYRFSMEKPFLFQRNAVHSIIDTSDLSFYPKDYSQFKFGDGDIANQMGEKVFEYFLKNDGMKIIEKFDKIWVFSSPYSFVPTSSLLMTKVFFKKLKYHLEKIKEEKNKSLILGKINRKQTYTNDYGELNAQERYNLIKNDTYEFDIIPKSNDFCIFIDDISITGTHQVIIEKIIEKNNYGFNTFFLYFAKLINVEVSPNFENYLNYFYVKGYKEISELMTKSSFYFTTRTVKFLLSLHDRDFKTFLSNQLCFDNHCHLEKLLELSLFNEYEKISEYSGNISILRKFLKHKNIS